LCYDLLRLLLNLPFIVRLQSLRLALSIPSTSIQLCMVGLVAGFVAAAVIILFRLCLEVLQTALLGSVGNYSAMPSWQLILLPTIAILLVIVVAKLTGFEHYRMGIPFVIHRFKVYYGHIPLATSINQFFGGILALASGFVVGKEGPTVHLAAAASHYVGRWVALPFNSLRILSGCGIAAGIAAAFNTPFAAVIFVMEVVMREYKVHIFVPVMLAAACGSILTRLVFGDITELSFLSFHAMEYWHYPILIILGVILGLTASLFNKQLMWTMRLFGPFNMMTRLLLAAAITGCVGYYMPSTLGAEFINIDKFIASSPQLVAIFTLFAAKFLLAIVAIALGVPGGIIGAVMVIGILAGVLFLQPLQGLLIHVIEIPMLNTPLELTTNYALLGLAGFLAAVLHAPLAALSAVMELSSTQQIILPALITIVSAYVTSKQLCNNRSIFIQQLDYQNLPYTTTAIRVELQDTGVMAIMRTDFKAFNMGEEAEMFEFLQQNPNALLVNTRQYEGSYEWELINLAVGLQEDSDPILRTKIHCISDQNTLAEVYELLHTQAHGGVAIVSAVNKDVTGAKIELDQQNTQGKLCGVITWNMLHTYLLRQQH
jgi:CIC family chloride channel protein